jgi:glucokinase
MILAGDIGGTKCHLALFPDDSDETHPIVERTFRSKEFPGLQHVTTAFLQEEEVRSVTEKIRHVCFGIAGPVVKGRVKTPNLPWTVTVEELEDSLGKKVSLINDLEAMGFGVLTLNKEQIHTLHQGNEVTTGHMALIAAGTGLGEALLIHTPTSVLPVPSEGGHTDFAPRNSFEIDLLKYCMKTWKHVSYERVLSGPGLYQIYSFLRDSDDLETSSEVRQRIETDPDPSAVISESALSGECPFCVRALDTFVSIYGAEAGNLALTAKTTGGVYLGGGIAPKILEKLKNGTFLSAFFDKGRMEALLKSIPVHVILEPKTALHGAAYYARHN